MATSRKKPAKAPRTRAPEKSRAKKAPVVQKTVGKKAVPKKTAAKKTVPRHEFTRGLNGWITHTDLASNDPAATKAWCASVLGWAFKPPFGGPSGEMHLFTYSAKGGGGIHKTDPGEAPGSTPFVHVADCAAAYNKALKAGAEAIAPPMRVMEGVTIALVRAPGGVKIGFSGP